MDSVLVFFPPIVEITGVEMIESHVFQVEVELSSRCSDLYIFFNFIENMGL
jgi:hypothetical protein